MIQNLVTHAFCLTVPSNEELKSMIGLLTQHSTPPHDADDKKVFSLCHFPSRVMLLTKCFVQ